MTSGNGFFFLLNLWRFLSVATRLIYPAANNITNGRIKIIRTVIEFYNAIMIKTG